MIRMFLSIFRSFGYAFQGIFRTVLRERNFRIHIVAVVAVSIFAFALYGVTDTQAILLILTYGMVLSAELMNTALEKAVDLISPDKHPLAKLAKDAAAGGVLIAAIAAVVVAVLLFRDGAKWAIVFRLLTTPVGIICFVIFTVLSLLFVKGKSK